MSPVIGNSLGWVIGVRLAGPLFLRLEGEVDGAAVDQQVLYHDEAGVLAAEEGAGPAEFLRGAEAVRRHFGHARFGEGVVVLTRFCGELGDAIDLALGGERAGQQVVDDDVVLCYLPREAGDEAGEPGARAVR